jgi:hypothetical protein
MKTISRWIVRVLLTLCVLGLIAPGGRADDAADWAHQQAQAQKEREDWYAQQAQAQRDREQAERDRQARDDWYKQQEQAQKERDEWYRQQAQTQRDREQAERDQKERDEWDKYQWQVHRDYQQSILNRPYDDHPWARAGWTAAAEWTAGGWTLPDSATPAKGAAGSAPPNAPAARPVPAPQARLPATLQQRLAMQNPAAFQQMVRQNQAQARQQIMQTRQQMLPGRQDAAQPQVIENPFVGSRTMIPGRPQLDHQIIPNPFVGRST